MKTKKIILIVLALAVIFSCAACGAKFDLEKYRADVADFTVDVLELSLMLSKVCDKQQFYWKATKNPTAEELVEYGYKYAGHNVKESDIKELYARTCEKYRALVAIEPEGNMANEIDKYCKEMFASMEDFYAHINFPSGNLLTFTNKATEYLDNITRAGGMLTTLVTK